MKIKNLINLTKDDLEKKENNIFIAYCLGNKFFKKDKNILEYIKFACKYTQDKVLILIVDEIQYTNYKIRYRKNTDNYILNRIKKDKAEILSQLRKLISTLNIKEQKQIKIITWKEFQENDLNCNLITIKLYKFWKNNSNFKASIIKAVKNTIKDRKFTKKQYEYLCDYVLDEFYLVFHGINYNNIYFNTYIYPYQDEVLELITNIQNKKTLTNIEKELPQNKTKVIIMN